MVLPPLGLATLMLCIHTYININVHVCVWVCMAKHLYLKNLNKKSTMLLNGMVTKYKYIISKLGNCIIKSVR